VQDAWQSLSFALVQPEAVGQQPSPEVHDAMEMCEQAPPLQASLVQALPSSHMTPVQVPEAVFAGKSSIWISV
jgi:hypothetical protein